MCINFNEKLTKIHDDLNDFYEQNKTLTDKLLHYLHDSQVSHEEEFFYGIIRRNYYLSRTIGELLLQLRDKHIKSYLTVFICLRTSLLDYITACYLLEPIQKGEKPKFSKRLTLIDNQTAKNIVEQLGISRMNESISKPEYDELLNIAQSHLPSNIQSENNSKNKTPSSPISPKEMKNSLKYSNYASPVIRAYELYQVLSSIEHYNSLTEKILRNSINNLKFIASITFFMFECNRLCISYLKPPMENEYRELFDKYDQWAGDLLR